MGRGSDQKVTVVDQGVYPVPDIPIKDLLGAIPYVSPIVFFLHAGVMLTISVEHTVSNAQRSGHLSTC